MRVGMLNSINFFSGLNAAVTVVFSDRDCYIKGSKLFRFDNVLGIYSLRMRKYGNLGVAGINLASPFASATSISCKTDVFPLPLLPQFLMFVNSVFVRNHCTSTGWRIKHACLCGLTGILGEWKKTHQ